MINFSRYVAIRERLIFLFNIINNREYKIWVAPKTLMSIEELRDRPYVTFQGSLGDPNYYNEPQLIKFTIPKLISIIPNAPSVDSFGFSNPNHTIIEIYESIQEYISLWCEIMVNTNEFKTPPRQELRQLETVAWFIYKLYAKIKPFKLNNDIRLEVETDMQLNQRGLAGLGVLFGSSARKDDLSFISHLDNMDTPSDFGSTLQMPEYLPPMPAPQPPPTITNGLATIETTGLGNNDWIFKE